MKNNYDAGTPELQAKRAELTGKRRSGLDYLYNQKTIDWEQYAAGLVYAATFAARYSAGQPKSCLANLCHIPSQEAWMGGQRWMELMAICDAQTLQGRISIRLAAKSNKSGGQKWHEIIERIAGHDDWGVQDVAEACHVHRDTAREYIRRAFDALVDCIDEVERLGNKN